MISRRWPPTHAPTEHAAATVGDALRNVGYSEAGVVDLLGDDAYSGGAEDVPVNERMLPGHEARDRGAGVLPPSAPSRLDDAVAALGRDAVEALEARRARRTSATRSRPGLGSFRSTTSTSRLTASPATSTTRPTTWPPTRRPRACCDTLTPRRRVARALDVGTGSGIHALRAAAHADHVVATDVNPRALEFTRLNAALNGLTNIETRIGKPLRARRRRDVRPDHVQRAVRGVARAPLDVPRRRRDRGRDLRARRGRVGSPPRRGRVRDDERQLGRPGRGRARRARRRLGRAARAARSRILVAEESDPLGHAAGWNSHLQSDPEVDGAALDEWASYLDELGVRWVSDGAVILKRRSGGEPTRSVSTRSTRTTSRSPASRSSARSRTARGSSSSGASHLLEVSLSVAMPLRLQYELEPTADAPDADRRGRSPGERDELRRRHDARRARDSRASRRRDAARGRRRGGRGPARARRRRAEGVLARRARPLRRGLLELGALRLD